MAKKDGGASKHASRFANRASERLKKAAIDARAGRFNAQRLAEDISNTAVDAIDLWTALLGFGASPQVGVAIFDAPQGTWKPGGVTTTVVLSDPVPDDAVFPGALKFRLLDGTATVDLQLTNVESREDGLELKISAKDVTPGAGNVAVGEYYVNLSYTSVSTGPGSFFAALLRAKVT
jgi:hypothetical protein